MNCIKSFFFLVCIFTCISLVSCRGNNKITVESNKDTLEENFHKDSIVFRVELEKKKQFFLNVPNGKGNMYSLRFINKTLKDTIIVRKTPRFHKKLIVSRYSVGRLNGKSINNRQYFFINENTKQLNLVLRKDKVKLIDSTSMLDVDSIISSYFIFKENQKGGLKAVQLKNKLDSLYDNYNKKYSYAENKQLLQLNELLYLERLQEIDPKTDLIDRFLKQLKQEPIECDILHYVLYDYIKNRILTLDYSSLNESYPNISKNLLARDMFNYIKIQKYKNYKRFANGINWLKTTEFYKKNKKEIDKEISPIDNIKFKKSLSKLTLINKELSQTTFYDVLKKNPSDYYLLDFWATWCKPCLEGINEINKMSLPKNIKVINLGTDKLSNKENWKKKAIETKQKFSYLINLDKREGKDFLKFIELELIPRYILIDKNMNIIDESYLAPHEPDFLTGLQNIKHL